MLGEFVWTGFDYIGEPTPYFDGRGRDRRTTGRRAVPISASSTWPASPRTATTSTRASGPRSPWCTCCRTGTGRARKARRFPVMAYTNAEEVELFLNGKSLGRKKRFSEPVEMPVGQRTLSHGSGKFTSKYRLEWQVPYAPGSLKAVAYQGGKQVAVDEVRTAGAPAQRRARRRTARRSHADGDDLSFVTVRIEDKDGNLCPMADNLVHFDVTGAGKIAAVDNGNAATVEPFQADHRKALEGWRC